MDRCIISARVFNSKSVGVDVCERCESNTIQKHSSQLSSEALKGKCDLIAAICKTARSMDPVANKQTF